MKRAALWMTAAALYACGGQTTEPGLGQGMDDSRVDSESHFLSFCVDGCPDGLSCFCGVCSRVCDEAATCDDLDAECVEPTPSWEGACMFLPARTVCDVACELDSDCNGAGSAHVCDRDVCRAAPVESESCPAVALPDCPEGEQLEVARNEGDCLTFACAAPNACFLPYLGDSLCQGPGSPSVWFNATRGRCERKAETCPLPHHFETEDECWNSCLADSWSTCLESWDETWSAAEIEPRASNNLVLDVATIQRDAVLELIGERRSARLTYPDRTQTELTLVISNPEAYHVTQVQNPWGGGVDSLGPHCWESVVVEADLALTSEDGAFDEVWARLPITMTPWNGHASVRLHLPTDWADPAVDESPFVGGYRAPLGESECATGSALELDLRADAMRGSLYQTVVPLPCSEVDETTPIVSVTPAASEPVEWLAPVPGGPVWNSVLDTQDAQFCDWSAPNYLGPQAYVRASDYELSLMDVEPATRASDVAAECEASGGTRCDPATFLTVFAAECLARVYGLEEGLEGVEGVLVAGDGEPQFEVRSTTTDNGAGVQSGRLLVIDAISGALLENLGWMDSP